MNPKQNIKKAMPRHIKMELLKPKGNILRTAMGLRANFATETMKANDSFQSLKENTCSTLEFLTYQKNIYIYFKNKNKIEFSANKNSICHKIGTRRKTLKVFLNILNTKEKFQR